MKQRSRIALSIFTAIWLSGCGALAPAVVVVGAEQAAWDYLLSGPGQPPIVETEINVDELKSVKTIALLEIPDTSGYGDFGLEFGEISFRSTTQKFLKQHLEESGFNVIDLPADRKNSLHLKDNYLGLESEVADAYLDVASVRIAYVTTGFTKYSDDGFGPHVAVALRLVSAVSKKVIYAGTVQYGWAMNQSVSGIKIDSPEEHRFENFETISVQKEEAIHHLEYGIEVISLGLGKKIIEGKLVGIATEEIDNETYDKGLWNEALVEAECDATKRRSIYIESRVKQLADENTSSASNLIQNDQPESIKPVGRPNLMGIYLSEITTNSNWVFNKKKHRELEITFEQIGNCIIGINSSTNLKISGIREGDNISFFTWPSDIVSSEIKGNWKVNADTSRMNGMWTHPHGSGKWNLSKIR